VAHDLEKKGLKSVMQAMHQLPGDVHLLCTTDKHHQSHWEDQLARAGLSGRIHWLSKTEPIELAYASADVLVHPTQADVYGMVVLEAMAHGLPVVCTKAPYCGAAWSWSHLNQAWLLESPEDIQNLVRGVCELRSNQELRARLIQSGQGLAGQQKWVNVALAIEQLMKQSQLEGRAT
jgi:UDP-glucose:(heptosyl)LPS alpha-1,3-glucosyltransferase